MKKFITVVFLFLTSQSLKAQTEIGVSLGAAYPSQKPANVDLLSSSVGIFSAAHNFKLKTNWYLQPQIQLQGGSYIMDGIFTKNTSNQYDFVGTPDNYKQSILTMYSIKMPVLLKYVILSDETDGSKSLAHIGIGPYIEYIFSAQQKFKIGTDNFKERAQIQNKFQYGVAADLTLYGRAIKKSLANVSMHMGVHYQLSDYLKDNTSFKPFMPYIGLGIAF